MQLLANTTSPFVRIARIALIEKGIDIEPTVVDPWADDSRLREANAATRVPVLITDDGTPLPESLLIVQWLERERPPPDHPSLLGDDALSTLSRAGIGLGVIDAAVHTIITRKATAPVLFDDTPVGLRRRRTMVEGMSLLEDIAGRGAFEEAGTADGAPTLDAICAVVAADYLHFRFDKAAWMRPMPKLAALSQRLRRRESFEKTMPY